MGKQELINGTNKDKTTWPAEAKVCDALLTLTQKLGETELMNNYLNGVATDELVDHFLCEMDNSNIIQCIIDLQQVSTELLQEVTTEGKVYAGPRYFRVIADLGIVLAKSPWWERYNTISSTMGASCILSIKTAVSLFKRDPFAEEIKTILTKLIKEQIT